MPKYISILHFHDKLEKNIKFSDIILFAHRTLAVDIPALQIIVYILYIAAISI